MLGPVGVLTAAAPYPEASPILHAAAEAARLAPSTHNTQPWRLRLRRDATLELAWDPDRHLATIDPQRRQMITSCGCALFNARIAIRAAGYREDIELFPDPERPEVVATIRLGLPRAASEDDLVLAAAIPQRHTNRRPFLDRPVSAAIADQLARAARAGRARLLRLDPAQKSELGWLVANADRAQFEDPRYREELSRWLAPRRSRRRDGIPFSEKEYGSSWPFALHRTLRDPGLGERFGELERDRILGAPMLVALAVDADEPLDWLDCGLALQAVLLRATALGLSASFLNQVLEVPEHAHAIAQLLETQLEVQMILRMGWAPPPEATAPRRPLEEILVVE